MEHFLLFGVSSVFALHLYKNNLKYKNHELIDGVNGVFGARVAGYAPFQTDLPLDYSKPSLITDDTTYSILKEQNVFNNVGSIEEYYRTIHPKMFAFDPTKSAGRVQYPENFLLVQ